MVHYFQALFVVNLLLYNWGIKLNNKITEIQYFL